MGTLLDPDEATLRDWQEWLGQRPPEVRALAERLPPWNLYRMQSTGHRVTMKAYDENGTVRVVVSPQYNCVVFGREVFGVDPDDLEVCEVPEPSELVGSPATGFTGRIPTGDDEN